MGCLGSKHVQRPPGYEDPIILASQTYFTISEIEALYELFRKLSSTIVDNGCINKEEFQLALFRNSKKRTLFSDRIFELFDSKRNGVIEFGEFVRSLSIFHPNTPEAEKISFAFQLYDIWQTGYIERGGVREMLMAILNESEMDLPEDIVESIVDQTFTAVDSKGDGKIDQDEWREFVARNPSSIQNMTVPYLKGDITAAFPSFIFRSVVEDRKLYEVYIDAFKQCYKTMLPCKNAGDIIGKYFQIPKETYIQDLIMGENSEAQRADNGELAQSLEIKTVSYLSGKLPFA